MVLVLIIMKSFLLTQLNLFFNISQDFAAVKLFLLGKKFFSQGWEPELIQAAFTEAAFLLLLYGSFIYLYDPWRLNPSNRNLLPRQSPLGAHLPFPDLKYLIFGQQLLINQ